MSVRALAWAFEQQVDPTAKLVLLALSDHVSEDGDCWVSIRALEGKTSLKERAIQLACRRLEAAGLIRKSPRFQGERQTTNLWQVVFRPVAKPPHPPALNAPSPPHEMRGEGAPDAPPGAHLMHPMNHSNEPSTEPNNTPLPPKGGKVRERKPFDAGEFDNLIPGDLALSGEFVATWHLWVEDRHRRRKGITENAAKLQLEKLAREARTPEAAVAWIRNSIEKGYTGLFPPAGGTSRPPNPRQSADDALVAQIQARDAQRAATQGGTDVAF